MEKQDISIKTGSKRCVMCNANAVVQVYETNEPLCESCWRNNLICRKSWSK